MSKIFSFNHGKQLSTYDPKFEKFFIITTETSNFAVGAILSQRSVGSNNPIANAPRTLNDFKKNLFENNY